MLQDEIYPEIMQDATVNFIIQMYPFFSLESVAICVKLKFYIAFFMCIKTRHLERAANFKQESIEQTTLQMWNLIFL